MVTVSHVVKKLINERDFLQEAIHQGIVSNSLLASKLKKDIEMQIGESVSDHSIIMALRRYKEKLDKTSNKTSFEYFTEIDMKTNITYIVVRSVPSIKNKLLKIYDLVNFKEGDILNIIQGNYLNGIITNQRYKDKILNLFEPENILYVLENLVSFSLLNRETYLYNPGFFYNIFRILAWDNINLLTVLDTPRDFIILVDQKDAVKCFNSLEYFLQKK
ncbi:MAG: hypothetical protein JXA91_00680 [Candidatus Thermoplasmatota archaeon]|nr:hypothetical protein [Candidatus Thermoplasmatota archaeon]